MVIDELSTYRPTPQFGCFFSCALCFHSSFFLCSTNSVGEYLKYKYLKYYFKYMNNILYLYLKYFCMSI